MDDGQAEEHEHMLTSAHCFAVEKAHSKAKPQRQGSALCLLANEAARCGAS